MKDLWANKVLFWSVILGFVTLIPTIYIPVINSYVFLQKGLTTGWAFAFLSSLFFLVSCEVWKFCKRHYYRSEKARDPEEDLEERDGLTPFQQFTDLRE